ncbi:MAG TPA: hypothetical protein VJ623_02500 [Holophagaceae bacterium]|nr:hypothetical protein [Holophagaceae bacterium]
MSQRLALIFLFLGFAACGGGGSVSINGSTGGSQALDGATARKVTNDLMIFESTQATSSSLPIWAPTPEGSALAFTPGASNICVTKGVPSAPDGNGYTHVLSTYSGCTGPQGGTLNGTVDTAFKNNDYYLSYNLTAALPASGLSWTYTGQRHLVLDPTHSQSTITSTIVVSAYLNGSLLGTENYNANLSADWATANQYKLWGTFNVTSTGQDTLVGTLSAAQPLIWSPGCCYPGSGTLALTRGTQSGSVTFALPCGQVTLSLPGSGDAAVALPGC